MYSAFNNMRRYYFDYAAATPLDPAVEEAMKVYWSEIYGNPGSLHWFGQEASSAVFKARSAIAAALRCSYKEIIFTGSATEANNLAVRGVVKRAFNVLDAVNVAVDARKLKIIISAIEHESVLATCKDLEKEGVEIIYLPVARTGVVDIKKLKESLDERVVLVSIMYANNVIGAVQPITEIAKIINEFKRKKLKSGVIPDYPFFHTDAVQAFNYLDCDVNKLGVDFLTLSSQKIYGPKGAGLLYAREQAVNGGRQMAGGKWRVANGEKKNVISYKPLAISPILTGGNQEWGLRGGTENAPCIIGFARAAGKTCFLRKKENARLKKLQDYFWKRVKKIFPCAVLNGGLRNRLPNNLNIYFPDNIGKDLLMKLDLVGFAVSQGSACSARMSKPSYVLKALGLSDEGAVNSLRITLGRPTTKKEIDKFLTALKNIASR